MMQIIRFPKQTEWPRLIQRPVLDAASLEATVKNILAEVRANGDEALTRFATIFDKVSVPTLKVSEEELAAAAAAVSPELQAAIEVACQNISRFHSSQQTPVQVMETMPGVQCWRRSTPIEKVGLYIPGGTAPLFSTILMLAIPAQLAGCSTIVLCTPPGRDGSIHPAILYTAKRCGITQIFKTGGAQAIAAMAYGTETIPQVYKIFGPGNQYVTAAKQLVQKEGVAIDMPAGPSEVCVMADDSAVPSFVAADLLSQAEHGTDSQVLLLTTSATLLAAVEQELEQQLQELSRKETAAKALANSKAVLLETEAEMVAMANAYAAEHLIICCTDAPAVAEQIVNAGSIFLGNYSPESVGDYASGTNHTLPTNGYARAYSGVSLDSFVKKITIQQLSAGGLQQLAGTVTTMAYAEGLDAHARAVELRQQFIQQQ